MYLGSVCSRRSEWVVVEARRRAGPGPHQSHRRPVTGWVGQGLGRHLALCHSTASRSQQPEEPHQSHSASDSVIGGRPCLTVSPTEAQLQTKVTVFQIQWLFFKWQDNTWTPSESEECAGHLVLSLPVKCKIKWKSAKWPDSVRPQFISDFSVNSRDIFVKRYLQ